MGKPSGILFTDSQCARLLARLERGPIDQMQALVELGIFRLAARINDLRKMGCRRTRDGDGAEPLRRVLPRGSVPAGGGGVNSAARGVGKESVDTGSHGYRIGKAGLSQSVLNGVLFGCLVLLPVAHEAFAGEQGEHAVQPVRVNKTDSSAVRSEGFSFLDQRFTDWVGDAVEFFASVAPQGEAMADKHPGEEKQGSDELFSFQNITDWLIWGVLGFLCGCGFFFPSRYDIEHTGKKLGGEKW